MTFRWLASVQHTLFPSERDEPLRAVWRWLTASSKKVLAGRENRRLRVAESVSLGDRRFVVLLQADNEHYLVGASAAGITLLTRLNGSKPQRDAENSPTDQTCPMCTVVSEAEPSPKDEVTPAAVQTQSASAQVRNNEFQSCMSRAEDEIACLVSAGQVKAPRLITHGRTMSTAFPLSGSEVRRHAFHVGKALMLLLAFHLVVATRALHSQQSSNTPATTAQAAAPVTTPAPSTPTASNNVAHTPAPKSLPQSKSNASGLSLTGLGGSSAPWTIVVLLTVLTLIPSLMICMTPFARLLVVFHFLRQALGLQTTPSNQTLIGLSLILTFFIMEPLGKQIYNGSFVPLENGQITALEAVDRGSEPLRHFMAHYVREKDAALFLEIAHAPRPKSINDVSLRVLMPAYIVSELKAGFQIGAVLFLPFLVVDIVIASITTSVGMMQLPPVVISTPLKLMLFLMVDGWHLLIGALVRSFY